MKTRNWLMLVMIALSIIIFSSPVFSLEACSASSSGSLSVTTEGAWFVTEPICGICRPKHCGVCDGGGSALKTYTLPSTYYAGSGKPIYIENLGCNLAGGFLCSYPSMSSGGYVCHDYADVGFDILKICNGGTCGYSYDDGNHAYYLGIYLRANSNPSQRLTNGPITFNNFKVQHYGYTSTYYRFRWSRDGDGDGYYVDVNDCNDKDADIHPNAAEVCDGIDNDCDSTIDEGCICTSGESKACGTDEGLCEFGSQTCIGGTSWSECTGGAGPQIETCNHLDDNCDGQVDENLAKPCYTGSAETEGIGVCKGGTSTCSLGSWGSCSGEVLPSPEMCNDGLDNDCDSYVDLDDPDCTGNVQYLAIPKIANIYLASFDVTGNGAVNPEVYIGEGSNSDDFLYGFSGTLDITERVNDFTGKIRDYLDNCDVPISAYCNVPISFHAEGGYLTMHNINVQFTNMWWNTTDIPQGATYKVMLVGEEKPVCGNGKLEGVELCDDGNLMNNDGCSEECTTESAYGFKCQFSDEECSSLGSEYVEVLKASDVIDAHASLPGQGDFPYHVCCKIGGGAELDTSSCDQAKFLQLSDAEDAHVQQDNAGGFTNNACLGMNPSNNKQVVCGYAHDCLMQGYDTCIASMSGTADAHIGMCNVYATNICCGVGVKGQTGLECRIKGGCDAGETNVFSMYKLYDSHVGTPGYYDYQVCCQVKGSSVILGDNCAASNAEVLFSKYKADDSHISLDPTYYDNPVCMSPDVGSIQCHAYDGTGSCDTGTCVFTVNQDDNSHVAGCAGTLRPYTKTICCEYSSEAPTPVVCGDGTVAGLEECDDGNTDNGDGCSATCFMERPEYVDNLIGYWNFDEGTGTVVSDNSANSNEGVIHGDSWSWTTGISGSALDFGGHDYIEVPDHSSLDTDLDNTITLESWVKLRTLPTSVNSYHEILRKDNSYVLLIYTNFQGSTMFRCVPAHAGGGQDAYSSFISTDTWYYVACTYDGTNTRIYLNGNLEDTGNPLTNTITDSTDSLYICSLFGTTRFVDGIVDEVAIYDIALTDEDILNNYNHWDKIKTKI